MSNRTRPGSWIEPMRVEHFDAVLALWKRTEGMGLTESDSRPALARYLARNRGLSFVVRDGKRMVAAVLCGHDGRRGYLYHLAVARSHRKHGLGRKLVERCLAKLEKLGLTRCNILVFTDNSGGEAFWLHQGWKKRSNVQLLQKRLTPSRRSRCC